MIASLTLWAQSDSLRVFDLSTRLQFAGLQGTLSAGVQHTFKNEKFTLGLMYGHSARSDVQLAYHGISFRSTFSTFELKQGAFSFRPYLILTANLEIGETAFLALPEEYPEDYYAPQALHAIGGFGLRTSHPFIDGSLSLTVETVTLDTYLWYTLIQEEAAFHEAWSVAIGVEYRFKR